MTMTCERCQAEVEPEDCTFGGLHRVKGCYGRVFDTEGKEYFGYMRGTKDWFYQPEC